MTARLTAEERERLLMLAFGVGDTRRIQLVAAVEAILTARLARVEALHARVRRYHYWVCEACSVDDGPGTPWPCDTVVALAASDPQEEGK